MTRQHLKAQLFRLAAALLVIFCVATATAAERKVLVGHVPPAVAQLQPAGQLPGAQRLNLAIGLPLRNQEGLKEFIQRVSDPASPQYRQYLSPAQFTEMFGPTAQDYQEIVTFAQTNGFTVTTTHDNRMLLDVNASVADIERAFHLTLRVYPHPKEARTFFAPDSEPSVKLTLPVLDISGLDNYSLPRPANLRSMPGKNAAVAIPNAGSAPGSAYRGYDFRAAYAPGVTSTGSGQAVGLLQFDGYYSSDITSYESATGLPSVPLQNVLLDGFNGSAGANNVEVALDIEMAISMAPGLSKVIVYEAGPSGLPNDILNRMATDNQAKQLSSSWTWSPFNTTADQIFQQFAAQGQSFFQASGDSDAYSGAVDKPADDPYITVVGGTTLSTTGAGGSWSSETVWNWGNGTGTGGGISTSYGIPSWQQGLSMSSNQGSTTMRNLPDVALTADNVWVAYDNGGSGTFGGTSCATPLWAGFMALVNQQAMANGLGAVGFANPAIYSLGKGANYGNAFHDITSGNNTSSTTPNSFYAVSGYDLCTGWGTPRGSGFINALAGTPAPNVVADSFAIAAERCANGAIDPGETVTINFGLKNIGQANTANLMATLQASGGVSSPSSAQTYGVLTAGASSVSKPFSFTANGSCGGTITATFQLKDGLVSLGSASFVLSLGQMLGLAQNFDTGTPPALPLGWTTATVSGTGTSWVTSSGSSDSAPNSAFIADSANAGANALISPVASITSSSVQLTFRQNYNFEYHTSRHTGTTYYDGGVLEIKIGGGTFADILAAGGSFASGGYNGTITTSASNPLGGRKAWVGNSSGWVTTTINLPAAAGGQNVQFRWNCGTSSGNNNPSVGWYVDSIATSDSAAVCCVAGADLILTQAVPSAPALAGQNLSYTLTVGNLGPASADNVLLTDNLPDSLTFVSGSPGCINSGNTVTCNAGTLASGGTTNFVVNVAASSGGLVTNAVTVSSTTANANLTNSTVVSVIRVLVSPNLNGLSSSGSGMTLSLTTVPGLTYTLEYKTGLNDPNWTPLLPAVTATGTSLTLQDSNTQAASRFYRVLCQ